MDPRGRGNTNDDSVGPGLLEEALVIIRGADKIGIPVRLVGGLAIRYLTPDFSPRAREGQDLDLASLSSNTKALSAFLDSRGYEPDRTFNALYGHKQLYFASRTSGITVDVLVDRIEMSHTLRFADRIERMPCTLDPCDLLLSKLQIFELNEKDLQDVLYLVSAFPVEEGDEPGTIGLGRFSEIVGEDWGWWRTVTLNLERTRQLALGPSAPLIPAGAPFDAVTQLAALHEAADTAPKSLRWRLRSKIGERKRWYELPEETQHF